MIVTQLLSPQDLLTLNQAQLDTIDTVIEAEILKSEECMKLLREKLEREYMPVIRALKRPG